MKIKISVAKRSSYYSWIIYFTLVALITTNFLVRKTRQKTFTACFSKRLWILSGLKEFSVRWVHFNCSLICTFLIIIFPSLNCQLPPSFLCSFLATRSLFCLCTFTFTFRRSTKSKNSAFHLFIKLNCALLLSVESLTWKFEISFKLQFQLDFSFAAINFWIIGGISSLKL